MPARTICETSLKWIVNYRLANGDPQKLIEIQHLDGHSGGSWAWTCCQSAEIDKLGWVQWKKTSGPEGYEAF